MALALGLAWAGPVVAPAFGSGRVSAAPPVGAADPGGPETEAGTAAAAAPVTPVAPVDPSPAADPPGILTPATAAFMAFAAIGLAVVIRRGWWRVSDAPEPARVFRAERSLMFAAGMLVAGLVLGSLVYAAFAGLPGGPPDPSTLAGALLLGGPVYAMQAAIVTIWWTGGRARAGQGPAPIAAARSGLVGLLVLWPMVVTTTTLVALAIVWAGGEPPAVIAHETLARIAADPWRPAALATIVLVTVLVPWIEEAVYRGMLQGGLVGFGIARVIAVPVVAAIFALRHLGIAAPHAVAGLFVLGLGLGILVERTGRLAPAVVLHAAFNAGNVLLAVVSSPAP
jgi:membrane protease YdiL (CAAX protease family)